MTPDPRGTRTLRHVTLLLTAVAMVAAELALAEPNAHPFRPLALAAGWFALAVAVGWYVGRSCIRQAAGGPGTSPRRRPPPS